MTEGPQLCDTTSFVPLGTKLKIEAHERDNLTDSRVNVLGRSRGWRTSGALSLS